MGGTPGRITGSERVAVAATRGKLPSLVDPEDEGIAYEPTELVGAAAEPAPPPPRTIARPRSRVALVAAAALVSFLVTGAFAAVAVLELTRSLTPP